MLCIKEAKFSWHVSLFLHASPCLFVHGFQCDIFIEWLRYKPNIKSYVSHFRMLCMLLYEVVCFLCSVPPLDVIYTHTPSRSQSQDTQGLFTVKTKLTSILITDKLNEQPAESLLAPWMSPISNQSQANEKMTLGSTCTYMWLRKHLNFREMRNDWQS